MKLNKTISLMRTLLMLLVIGASISSYAQNQYYVSISGSNGNNGTSVGTPWRTFAFAAANVVVGANGAVVNFSVGNYDEVVSLPKGGGNNTTARLAFVCTTAWTVGGSNCRMREIDIYGVNNIDIGAPGRHGFEVTNSGGQVGINNNGNFCCGNGNHVIGNYIHDISVGVCASSGAILSGKHGLTNNQTGFQAIGNLIDNIGNFGGTCGTMQGIYVDNVGALVQDNIITRAAAGGIQYYDAACSGVVSNNIIANTNFGLIFYGGNGCTAGHNTAINNIIVNNNVGIYNGVSTAGDCVSGAPILFSNNIMSGNGTNYHVVNPGCEIRNTPLVETPANTFVSYTGTATGDFHLKSTSIARHAGTPTCVSGGITPCIPTKDIDGNAFGSPIDIGVYNSTGSAPPQNGLEDLPDTGGTTGCATGNWCWEHDAATAGTASATSSLTTSPSTDGQARQFNISWTAFGGLRAHAGAGYLPLNSSSASWVLDTQVQFSDLTHVNVAEFDFNQVIANGDTIIFGTQCNFGTGVWQYATRNGTTPQWNNTTIPCLKADWLVNSWHHLILAFHRLATGVVVYDTVTFDGTVSSFNGASGPENYALGWTPIGVQVVNFQVDGDNSSNSTVAYLGSMTVTGSGNTSLISFIQSNSTALSQTTATTVNTSYSPSQVAGHLNIVAVGWNNTTSTVSSVTDSAGNLYTRAIGPTLGTNMAQSIYFAKNIAGGPNTVTVTFNQATQSPDIRIYEYTGLDGTAPFDIAAGASGAGTLANSGNMTTTAANELIFGAGMTFSSYSGAGAGYTSRGVTAIGDIGEDKVVTTTGSYNATAPNVVGAANPGNWVFQAVGFTASGTSGGGITPPPPPPPPPPSNCTMPAGGWSTANRPPVGCTPYPNGLWVKPLPNAGSGGPMTHLAPNSDGVAVGAMSDGGASTGYGGWSPATPGGDDLDGQPLYYGHAADPKYTITCSHVPGDGTHNPTGKAYHAPSGAKFSNITGSDQWLEIWDQTTNQILSMYFFHGDQVLPTCASGQTCAITPSEYCGTADYTNDPGFKQGVNTGQSDSLGNSPFGLTITMDEWISGTIPHALYMNTDCEDTSTGPSFPGVGQARDCASIGQSNTNRPKHGALMFFDYTDAQLNAMNLPSWQKPLIKAMMHYGGYQGDTGNGASHISRYESGQPYLQAGVTYPMINFLGTVNGIHCVGPGAPTGSQCRFSSQAFVGLPNVVGPNCPTSTCGILQHAHIADPCVPLGLAGLPGGCVNAPLNPPVLNSVSPASGIVTGGNTVAIGGTGFLAGVIVRFNGVTATNTVVSSSNAITVTVPAGALGTVTVTVTNTDGQVGSLASAYTYTAAPIPVSVTSISPATGDVAGGTMVSIGGTGFLAGVTVTIGTAATSVVLINSTTITAKVPANAAAGAVNVVVNNANGTNGTLTNGFTYTSIIVPPPPPPPTGTVTIAPLPGLNFGGSNVGVVGNPQTFTLTNTFTTNINVTNIAFSGANPTDFSKVNDNCTGASTPSNGTCAFQVEFQAGAVGLRSGIVTASGPGFTPVTATLQGTGIFVSTGAVVVTPSLSFGNITVLANSPLQTITVTNNKNSSVTVGTVTISGDFTLANNNCTAHVLAPGIACTVQAMFTPSIAGARTGTVTIPGTGFTTLTVPLDGTGTSLPLPPSSLIAIVN